MTYLLSGHTINDIEIRSGTIKTYMRQVNKHYRDNGLNEPWNIKSETDAVKLLKEQEKYESEPARRAPLPDEVIVKMKQLADSSSPLGMRATIWNITAMGRLGGFRQQEFAMDKKDEIKTYVLPNGAQVTRAFVVRNFLYRDEKQRRISSPLLHRNRINEAGPQYDVQKNRVNGQIIWFARDREHPEYCFVENSLTLLWRAQTLGQGPEDPICVYQDRNGTKQLLTGTDVTEYFRFVVRLVNPSIDDAELKLISTHSIRVTACVLLAEAGKEGWYIKLRLRWLSDCYTVYIRNTTKIAMLHKEAANEANNRLDSIVVTLANLPEFIEQNGIPDVVEYDLEDED